MNYLFHLLTMVCLYSTVSTSLKIATCRGVVLAVAPTLFMASGAYSAAIMGEHRVPQGVGLIFGIFLGAAFGALIGWLALRLDGDYLLLASLGTCEILRSLLVNAESVTGGPIGIMNIPNIAAGSSSSTQSLVSLCAAIATACGCVLFEHHFKQSQLGIIHRSVDGDYFGASALGHPVALAKVVAIIVSGSWMSIVGWLYAVHSSYIDPTAFSVEESIGLFSMFVFGGMQRTIGIVAGTSFYVLLPEALRLVGIPNSAASSMRRILFGICLVMIMYARARRDGPGKYEESPR